MNAKEMIVGTMMFSMANVALAGPTAPLGSALGVSLAAVLGTVFGNPLGFALPIASGGLLVVAAVSLLVGISIVRRKRHRQAETTRANRIS